MQGGITHREAAGEALIRAGEIAVNECVGENRVEPG